MATKYSKQQIPVDRLTQEKTLRDTELGVWCAACTTKADGHSRILDIMNSERYIRKILAPFYENLTDMDRHDGFIQQYSVTVHTSCQSLGVVRNVLGTELLLVICGLLVRKIEHNVTIRDYYLWEVWKTTYRRAMHASTHTQDKLKKKNHQARSIGNFQTRTSNSI